MLNEKQIPETETILVDFTNYEKNLVLNALKNEINKIERVIESTYVPKNPDKAKEYEKEFRDMEQKIRDINMVINRIEKRKWVF